MMQPLTLCNVTKAYGATTALDDVSLTFEPGEVHALLGPNGAGKTTLFRILLGLTPPDTGSVSMPDVPVGYSFQEPRLYTGLTVQENLSLFAELTGASEEWVETLVDRCGLDRVRHRSAGALSAGFAKRLDLAVALIDRPDVVFLDEPLADIDDKYRSRLCAFLSDYATDDRILVISTHQFDWFEAVLDTITILDDGTVRASNDVGTVTDDSTIRAYYARHLGIKDPSYQ